MKTLPKNISFQDCSFTEVLSPLHENQFQPISGEIVLKDDSFIRVAKMIAIHGDDENSHEITLDERKIHQ